MPVEGSSCGSRPPQHPRFENAFFRMKRVAHLWRSVGLLLTVGLLLSSTPSSALSMQAPRGATPWTVENSEFADLWFHGLASLGFEGPRAGSLYRAEYHRSMQSTDVSPSALWRQAGSLGRALRRDPAFEILHFVPVYLHGVTVAAGLAALSSVADGSLSDPSSAPQVRRATEAIGRVLNTSDQREVLKTLVEALRREQAEGPRLRRANPRAVEPAWRALTDELSPELERWGLHGGVLVLSPPLGSEGRFFLGNPDDPRDNLVFVHAGAGVESEQEGGPGAVVAAGIRELCFPAVRIVFRTVQGEVDDPVAEEGITAGLATRCGALLLEANASAYLADYQRTFPDSGTDWGNGLAVPQTDELIALLEVELRAELSRSATAR